MSDVLLEARGLVKRFGHVTALDGADFTVRADEIVALVGDNGAGKSTLVKALSGVHALNAGEIRFKGEPITLASPVHARELGIETVYQDLALAPDLEPAANLFLGRELLRAGLLGRLGLLDKAAMRRRTDEAFATLGVALRGGSLPVATLSGGQRQGVAVSRAVMWASQVIFMDEPTAALGVVQTRAVLDLIRQVKRSGRSVVLVSHNMPEVFEVADRIEVLRLGRRVAQLNAADATMEDVIGAMTGALAPTGAEA
jgi:simple sugar transport system ATP-binding protein